MKRLFVFSTVILVCVSILALAESVAVQAHEPEETPILLQPAGPQAWPTLPAPAGPWSPDGVKLPPGLHKALDNGGQLPARLGNAALKSPQATLAPIASGGPDAFGYAYADSNEPGGPSARFEDISGLGAQITFASDYYVVNLPFAFPFYDASYTQTYIYGDCLWCYGDSTHLAFGGPDPETYGGSVQWMDQIDRASGAIYVYSDTLSSPRRFIVQYSNVNNYIYDDWESHYSTSQVILYENGDILVRYASDFSWSIWWYDTKMPKMYSPGYGWLTYAGYPQDNLAVQFYYPQGTRLWPLGQQGAGPGGGQTIYTFDLYNDTGAGDSFSLTVSYNAWPTTISPTQTGAITDGGVVPIVVTVNIPLGAMGGETDAAIIQASSVASPTVYTATAVANTRVAGAPILLVDDDAGLNTQSYYTAALEALGYAYDLYGVPAGSDGPSAPYLQAYDTVIWFLGNSEATLSAKDAVNLKSYLNNGGRLLMSGGFVAYNLQFLAEGDGQDVLGNYLGYSYVGLGWASFTSSGEPGNPVADGLTLEVYTGGDWDTSVWPYVTYGGANGPAETAFALGGNAIATTRIRPAASPGYKTVLLGFNLAGVNGAVNRQALLGRALRWLAADYGVAIASQQGRGGPGRTVTYTVPIKNTGLQTDTYDLDIGGNAWPTTLWNESLMTQITRTGSVSAGVFENVVVSVTIPASAVMSDTDAVGVTATSSYSASITGTATMTTIASLPILATSPTLVDFGVVYVGLAGTQPLTLRNAGTVDLNVTAMGSDHPDYTVAFTPMLLAPGNSGVVTVTFAPSSAGTTSATLSITSNAGVSMVLLSGAGVGPPTLHVTPPAIEETLAAGAVATRTLTISNAGDIALTFEMPVGMSGRSCAETYGSRSITYYGSARDRGNIFHILAPTTLSETQMYLSFAYPTDMYFFVYESSTLNGSYTRIHQTFIPFTGSGERWYSSGPIAVVLEAGKYYYIGASWNGTAYYWRGTESVPRPAACLGTLETGMPAPLAGYPPGISLINTYTGQATYYMRLSVDVPWLWGSPSSGSVAAGSSAAVSVTLDATDLVSGTYYAGLAIQSNDPLTPALTVPVTLTVIGTPTLVIAPASLDFGAVYVGMSRTLSLTLSNASTNADLSLSAMGSSQPDFGVAFTPTRLVPGNNTVVTVTFEPAGVGPMSATLTITSNAGISAVLVSGNGLLPPSIDVIPSAIEESLAAGASKVLTLTIANDGGSNLGFAINGATSGYGSRNWLSAGNSPFALTRIDAEYSRTTNRIYILGGRLANSSTDGTIWEFDPATGISTSTGISMPTPVSNYQIARLVENDGDEVFVVFGGRTITGASTGEVQGFYPSTQATVTFTSDPFPHAPAYAPGGVAVVDNKAYVFGGYSASVAYSHTYIFDISQPAGSRWTPGPDLSLARGYIASAVVDGVVYAMGGDAFSGGLIPQTIVEKLDPGIFPLAWDDASVADLPVACDEMPGFGFDSDSPYGLAGAIVTAGCGRFAGEFAESMLFQVGANTWDLNFPDLNQARRNHAGVFVPWSGGNSPAVWVFGGRQAADSNVLGAVEYYTFSVSGPTWLSILPRAGAVPAYDTRGVDVTLDATDLISGAYHADISIQSNDPFTPELTVPVTLTVIGTPTLVIAPASLDFGAVYVGMSRTLPLTLSNAGTADLRITAIGSSHLDYGVTLSDTLLAPGESSVASVIFAPSSGGSISATLAITTRAGISTVMLSGAGLWPAIQVTPTEIGETLAAGDVATRTLMISNAGNSELTFEISTAPDWLLTNPISGAMAAGSRAVVAVTLDATDLIGGVYWADLAISSNDPFAPTVTVPVTLHVTGIPSISVAPGPLDMGTAYIGYTTTRLIQISNPGTADLNISFVASNDPALSAVGAPMTIPARGQRTVQLVYAPTFVGTLGATLFIYSNAPGNGVITLQVAGRSVHPPALAYSPTSFDVSVNTDQIVTRTLLVENTGLGILDFDLSTLYDWGAGLRLTPLPDTLPAGSQQVISVTFDGRQFAQGNFTNGIFINSNDPVNPHSDLPVALSVVLVPPEMPSNPSPQNGEVNVRIDKTLSWQASPHATSYDLTLWQNGQPRPVTPTVSGLGYSIYDPAGYFLPDTVYHWSVLARNNVGPTQGQEWAFTTELMPDLQVITVTVPSSAYSGQSFQMSWVVDNNGNRGTTAPTWYDLVYLSASPVFDVGIATYLGRATNSAYLGPGESYRTEATFSLPQGVSGPYYVFVLTDYDNWMRESDETNNAGVSMTTNVILTPPPDLQVVAVSGPSNAFSGDHVEVTWVVQNNGTGGTVGGTCCWWYDRLYLSVDATFHITDTELSTVYHIGALAPGEAYTQVVSVALPQAIFGDYYFFAATDIYNQMYEYASEGNNTSAPGNPIAITLSPPPDLEIASLDVPAAADSATVINVTWVVANNGAGSPFETSLQDRVYLSPDPVLSTTNALVLGTFLGQWGIAPGESYTRTASLVLPVNVSGTRYIHVWTDYANQVFEFADDNNTSSAAIAITLRPPNLLVSGLSAPGNAQSGDSVNVTWNVINQGTGPTFESDWQDRVYLSTQAVLNPDNAVVLGTFAHAGRLAPSASYTQSRNLNLPNGISGAHYIHVWTDYADQVFEHTANGDNITTAPVNIILAPSPDLRVAYVSTPATTTVLVGSPIRVTWIMQNTADDTPTTIWHDKVYLSPLPTWSGSGALLGSFARPRALRSGQSYTQTRDLIVPAYQAANSYYIYVWADADNVIYEHNAENNNTGRSSGAIVVTAIPPTDLVIGNLAGPNSGDSGQSIVVSWTVTNTAGHATQASSWTDGVYLSSDTILNPATDTRLGDVVRSGALQGRASYARSLTVNLPNGLAGDYFLLFRNDIYSQVNDANRANNTAYLAAPISIILSPSPDLQSALVSPPPTTVAGQPVNIAWSVNNIGPVAAVGGWYDAIYLSADASLGWGDIQLSSRYHGGGLAVSDSYTGTATVAIPGSVSGIYYLLVKTDSRNDIYEHNAEQNNMAAWPVDITVLPPADLVVLTVTVPANAMPSEWVTLDWDIQNQGASPASGYMCDAVYISADAAWDINDAHLGNQCRPIYLAPGATNRLQMRALMPDRSTLAALLANLTGQLPGVTPGAYYAIVRTDILNHIRESNDGNNAGASTNTIAVDVEELTLGVPRSGNLGKHEARFYRVNVPAGETLLVTLNSSSTLAFNELYVRIGEMPSRGVFDFTYGTPYAPDQEIVAPLTFSGTYYILMYGNTVPEGVADYAITADVLAFSVREVTPAQVGNAGPSTLKIKGARFTRDTLFQLIGPGGAILDATRVIFRDSSLAYATFDLTGQPTGAYAVQAIRENGATALLEDALAVVAGIGARFEVNFMGGPATVRPNGRYVVYVDYANTGDADGVAPLLLVQNPSNTPAGFAPDALVTETLQVMAIGSEGPAGILRPGERRTVPLYFKSSTPQVNLRLFTITANDSRAIDWGAIESYVRPAGIPDGEWVAVWANIQNRLGNTWGSYVGGLAETATLLSQRGEATHDARDLFVELYLQEAGYPTSIIAGQLISAQTGQRVVGATVIARSEVNTTTAIIRAAVTDQQGRFEITSVPSATYDLIAEGYYFSPTLSYTAAKGVDVTGLILYANPIPPDPAPLPPKVMVETPQLLDVAGTPHLVYVNNGQIYHTTHNGSGWADAVPVPGAQGKEPKLLYSPTLLDGTSSGLALFWRSDSGNESVVKYAAARQDGMGGWDWSEVMTYSSTGVANLNHNAVVDASGTPVVAWQMINLDNGEADTDLYYDHQPIVSGDLQWPDVFGVLVLDRPAKLGNGMTLPVGSVVALAESGQAYVLNPSALSWEAAFGLDFKFDKKGDVPSYVPYIGGQNRVAFKASLYGIATETAAKASGSIGGEVSMLRNRVTGSVSGGLVAEWSVDPGPCQFQFNQATLSTNIGVEGKFAIPQLTYNVWGNKIEVAAQVGGTLGGTLIWKGQGGAWPEGEVKGALSLGLFGEAELMNELGKGEVVGTGNLEVKLDKQGFNVSDAYFQLKAKSCVNDGWISPCWEFTERWPPEETDFNHQAFASLEQAVQAALSPRSTAAITLSLRQKAGTGDVYAGTTILTEVGSDLVDDGAPVLAQGTDGLTYAFWTRPPEGMTGTLGTRIVYATYNGAVWSPPQTLTGTLGFNRQVAVVTDTNGDLLLAWAHADSSGFTIESDANAVLEAYQNADVWFARLQAGGVWLTPTLLALGNGNELSSLSLNRANARDAWATWVQADPVTHTLYAARWDGVSWSTPLSVATGGLVRGATAADIGGVPTLVWVQAVEDYDDDPNRSQASRLYSSTFVSDTWTAPIEFTLNEAAGPTGGRAPEAATGGDPSFQVPLSPPAEACPKKPPKPKDPPEPAEPTPGAPTDPPVWPSPPASYTPPVITPRDPNDIIGPTGFGDARWMAYDATFGYTIRFENDETQATAPAQRVVITQTLDSDLDLRTFRLGAFGFGDYVFETPPNRSFYQARLGPFTITTTLPATQSFSVYVDVNAGIDIVTGQAFWILQTIDPATGAPPTDAAVGFLPPDVEGSGQGFATYVVRPKSTAQTLDVVDAWARIIFDSNDPLDTPAIFNTLDAGKPTSSINALPPRTGGTEIVLTWNSSDDANGSGPQSVDVYVSTDGALFNLAQADVAESSLVFRGAPDHTYGFFARAQDNAGNREPNQTSAEATTFLYLPGEPAFIGVTANPLVIVADGASTSAITATVRDGVGDLLTGEIVTFTTTLGTLSAVTATTDLSGTAAVSLASAATPGAALVTAIASGDLGLITNTLIITMDQDITNLTAANSSPTTLGQTTYLTAAIATGSNVVYEWDYGDGSLAIGSQPSAVSHVYPAAATYTAIVTANNSVRVITATTTVTITNLPPIANAGPDQDARTGTLVTLNGSASVDPDGHLPLAYLWTQTGGTPVTLSSNAIAAPTFTAPAAPTGLTLALVVTDARGLAAAAPDTVAITVTNWPITGLVVINSSPTTLGQPTWFTATVTSGTDVIYDWYFGDSSPVISDQPPVVSHTYPAALTYTAVITARNAANWITATATVGITNMPPIANAGPDQDARTGTLVTLNGSASVDPDGHLPLAYLWTQTGGTPVTLSSNAIAAPTFTAPGAPTGLTLALVVTDARGLAAAVPDTVVITVSSSPCIEVTTATLTLITPGPIYAGTLVQFGADVLPDNADKPYTYTVDYGVGPVAPLTSSADPLTFTHTLTMIGASTVKVTVWNCAMTQPVTDTVQVTVERKEQQIYLPIILVMGHFL